jgi:hypothetical protein
LAHGDLADAALPTKKMVPDRFGGLGRQRYMQFRSILTQDKPGPRLFSQQEN